MHLFSLFYMFTPNREPLIHCRCFSHTRTNDAFLRRQIQTRHIFSKYLKSLVLCLPWQHMALRMRSTFKPGLTYLWGTGIWE